MSHPAFPENKKRGTKQGKEMHHYFVSPGLYLKTQEYRSGSASSYFLSYISALARNQLFYKIFDDFLYGEKSVILVHFICVSFQGGSTYNPTGKKRKFCYVLCASKCGNVFLIQFFLAIHLLDDF